MENGSTEKKTFGTVVITVKTESSQAIGDTVLRGNGGTKKIKAGASRLTHRHQIKTLFFLSCSGRHLLGWSPLGSAEVPFSVCLAEVTVASGRAD